MSKPVVLLYESMHPAAITYLKEHAEVRMAASLKEDDLLKEITDVEGIIIRANGKVSRRLMEATPQLKVVGRHGVGIEAIDRQAAHEKGIVVVNTPDANLESVAEQCIGFMVILAKRMVEADQALRGGDWNSRNRLHGIEMYGKTLGVIGFGKIGQRVAEMAHLAFAMPVIYFDVINYPEAEKALGARRLELNQVLQIADFVSVHTPLLPSTQGMLNEDKFRLMKKTAFFLNSSRGAVVDQPALIKALQEGWIRGAGLDVFEPEPLPADSPLLKMDNVVVSPHMAAHTNEALFRMAMVAEDIVAVIEGNAPKYPVVWKE